MGRFRYRESSGLAFERVVWLLLDHPSEQKKAPRPDIVPGHEPESMHDRGPSAHLDPVLAGTVAR